MGGSRVAVLQSQLDDHDGEAAFLLDVRPDFRIGINEPQSRCIGAYPAFDEFTACSDKQNNDNISYVK